MEKLPLADQLPNASRSCTYNVCGPRVKGTLGDQVRTVVSVHIPVVASNWKRNVPLPPPPDVHVQAGWLLVVGEAGPETIGASGGFVSTNTV